MGVCRKRGECSPRAWSVSNCDRWAASPACSGQPPSSLGAGTAPSVRPREGTRRSGAPGPEALSCPQPPSVLRPPVTASVRPGAARRQRGTRGRGVPEQHTVVPGGTFGPMQTKGVWCWGPAPAGANGRFVCFINSGLSSAETGRRGEASCRRVRPPSAAVRKAAAGTAGRACLPSLWCRAEARCLGPLRPGPLALRCHGPGPAVSSPAEATARAATEGHGGRCQGSRLSTDTRGLGVLLTLAPAPSIPSGAFLAGLG